MKTKIRLRHTALVFFLVSSLGSFVPARAAESVRIWEESLVVPTYLIEAPDPNPVFYFGRAYQGAQGPVYPYPFLDRLTDRKVDKETRSADFTVPPSWQGWAGALLVVGSWPLLLHLCLLAHRSLTPKV